jgi:hypothetical protein
VEVPAIPLRRGAHYHPRVIGSVEPSLRHASAAVPVIWDWLQQNKDVVLWLFVLSIGSLVVTALLLPVFVLRLPPDYFLASRRELAERRGALQWIGRIARNGLGALFVLAGLAMLVLPGQGLLTMFIGLLLVDFPGKRALERRVVQRPAILGFLNRLRGKHGKPPLQVD